MAVSVERIGAVVIARNEGPRLVLCLRSVCRELKSVVYVDSGSTDGSVEFASSLQVEVVELTSERAFTAARARNAGVQRLRELYPGVEFVQLIDGDCELQPGWIQRAASFLEDHPKAAIACGRRREQHPGVSTYNRLCDMEWDTPIGPTSSCGGDSLVRLSAFEAVRGFSEDLIAGEEPDLCFRLRQQGWEIHRLDAEMTLHDASMTTASQWWRRAVRSGYATAEASRRRGAREPGLRRQVISNLLWSLPPAWPLWPLLWFRVRLRRGGLYATHVVLAKIPQSIGQMRFWWRTSRGQAGTLIEYK